MRVTAHRYCQLNPMFILYTFDCFRDTCGETMRIYSYFSKNLDCQWIDVRSRFHSSRDCKESVLQMKVRNRLCHQTAAAVACAKINNTNSIAHFVFVFCKIDDKSMLMHMLVIHWNTRSDRIIPE